MKPLIVLAVTSVLALVAIKITQDRIDPTQAARIGMSAMLLFTALGHVLYTRGMAMMLPESVPWKQGVVYGTGIIEILAAIGLLLPKFRVVTAWLLIIFFIAVLPANIRAAIRHINHQQGTLDGNGPAYLWFRIPLQLLFILWVYISSIKY